MQTRAPRQWEWTVFVMALMSWIVPRMLLACVRVTSLVLELNRPNRFSGVNLGFALAPRSVVGSGFHHLMTSFWRSARSIQEATLDSWSTDEMTSSSPSLKLRVQAKFRYSCVVEEPRTGGRG